MIEVIVGDVPPQDIIDVFLGDTVTVERFVDIYEADNVTPWLRRVAVTEGSVSVDSTRDVRRNLDITFHDADDQMGFGPDEFWYDKIIKPYRGVQSPDGQYAWVTPLGEFMIDKITRPHFPSLMQVTCRDLTKKLLLNKLTETTTFSAGAKVEDVISAVASNGGIVKMNLAITDKTLAYDITFDRGTDRWKIITDLAESINHEVFFDNFGNMTLRPYIDPISSPLTMTFNTGANGNLVSYSRQTEDSRLYNHVVVYGDNANAPMVFAEAENTEPSSPTNIARLGRRTYTYASQFITDNTQALAVAQRFLSRVALEQYDISMESFVLPWLEGGDAIKIILPNTATYEPTRFILPQFTIPLGLAPQSGSAKRVSIIG